MLASLPFRNSIYYTWWAFNDQQEGNVTVSTLNLKVTSVNDGAELMCRATNPWFSSVALEDKRIISVAC